MFRYYFNYFPFRHSNNHDKNCKILEDQCYNLNGIRLITYQLITKISVTDPSIKLKCNFFSARQYVIKAATDETFRFLINN